MEKDKDYRKLINTTRWQKLRMAMLRAHPLCQRCESEGETRIAAEVHHIVPVSRGLSMADKARLCYDPANLMCLCRECHKAIHEQMGLGKGRKARAELEKRKAKKAIAKLFGEDQKNE